MTLRHDVPFILPDEHFASVSARWSQLSGATPIILKAGDFEKAKPSFFQPSVIWSRHFHTLIERYKTVKDTNEYISEHSTLLYELPFLMNIDLTDLKNLREADRTFPEFKANVYGYKHWKLCKECLEADRARFGHSYWHASHQLPLVHHCKWHSAPLINATTNGKVVDTLSKMNMPELTDKTASNPVLSELESDIESQSLYLNSYGAKFDQSQLIEALRHFLGVEPTYKNTVSANKSAHKANKSFREWCEKNGVFDRMITPTPREKHYSQIPAPLNIFRLAYFNGRTNTSCALIIANYLNLDLRDFVSTNNNT